MQKIIVQKILRKLRYTIVGFIIVIAFEI